MPSINTYVARVEGICGGEGDIVVSLKTERKEVVIVCILKRCKIRKSHSTFMFELEWTGVVFRLFSNGRIVFRGIKNKRELNKILYALLI
jgi:hypothetical protein